MKLRYIYIEQKKQKRNKDGQRVSKEKSTGLSSLSNSSTVKLTLTDVRMDSRTTRLTREPRHRQPASMRDKFVVEGMAKMLEKMGFVKNEICNSQQDPKTSILQRRNQPLQGQC